MRGEGAQVGDDFEPGQRQLVRLNDCHEVGTKLLIHTSYLVLHTCTKM